MKKRERGKAEIYKKGKEERKTEIEGRTDRKIIKDNNKGAKQCKLTHNSCFFNN